MYYLITTYIGHMQIYVQRTSPKYDGSQTIIIWIANTESGYLYHTRTRKQIKWQANGHIRRIHWSLYRHYDSFRFKIGLCILMLSRESELIPAFLFLV